MVPPPKKARGAKKPESPFDDPDSSASGSVLSESDDPGTGTAVLLAQKFDLHGSRDPTGYWMSEKLDGVRAVWDGQGTIRSRVGKKFHAPQVFLDCLPHGQTLDGELFTGRDKFDATSGTVRRHSGEGWEEMRFMVFDLPSEAHRPFEERMKMLREMFPKPVAVQVGAEGEDSQVEGGEAPAVAVVEVVEQEKCRGWDHLNEKLIEVQAHDGEGLMLRQPGSLYVPKRSTTLLKVKTFYDAEARVVGYEPGKVSRATVEHIPLSLADMSCADLQNKYTGMVGSLICEMANGKQFSVGSGLTDYRRTDDGRPEASRLLHAQPRASADYPPACRSARSSTTGSRS